jgi:uncharacterized membrane protein YphA (DoxX/SURF4 family)
METLAMVHNSTVPTGDAGGAAAGAAVTGAARVVASIAQVVVALILLQTLYFKFTGAEESKYIFATLGMEPWGRYASGVAELIAGALLLIGLVPKFGPLAAVGAAMALGVIVGAIGAHLTKLGIEVKGDGGLLFGLAVVVFIGSAVVVWIRRAQLPVVGPKIAALTARG